MEPGTAVLGLSLVPMWSYMSSGLWEKCKSLGHLGCRPERAEGEKVTKPHSEGLECPAWGLDLILQGTQQRVVSRGVIQSGLCLENFEQSFHFGPFV